MRVFSLFEKQFLRKILELEKSEARLLTPHSFLRGLLKIKPQVTIVGRDHDYELKEGESQYYKIEILGKEKDIPNDYFEVTDKLYEANDLINYLLENGYLLRHEGGRALGLLFNMQDDLIEGNNDVKKEDIFIKKTLREFLEKCSYYYQPTEALRDLVRHNFKTKAERNNYWTRVISIVAIIISLISLFIDSCKTKRSEPQTIKLDTASLNYYFKLGTSAKQDVPQKVDTQNTDTIKPPHK